MGVLPCSRQSCENIMCDRYSPRHGYICNECFEELIDSGVYTNIAEFLDSTKKEKKLNIIMARELFDQEFPDN